MVVFDSSVLLLVLDPNAKPPNDPSTGQPLKKAAQRIERLIADLTADKEKIVIPTPVLSEVRVHARDAMQPISMRLGQRSNLTVGLALVPDF